MARIFYVIESIFLKFICYTLTKNIKNNFLLELRMKKSIRIALVFLLSIINVQIYADSSRCKLLKSLTTLDTKNYLVVESIANYKKYYGNCPCPYSLDAAGEVCGDRSAYIRPGGLRPYCHYTDISDFEMIRLVQKACHPCDKWHSMPTVDVQKIMIKLSIKNYHETVGDCPCPYSLDNSSLPCNDRSGYIMSGRKTPYCYVTDINIVKVSEFINAMCLNLEN